jgi:chromosome segregation ATPase
VPSIVEQLTPLGVKPGDQDSATRSLTALKTELAEEKAAREKAQAKTETLAWAVEGLKKSTDRFATQIPDIEEKIKLLDNKVLDRLTKHHDKELSLEQTTKANKNYKNRNTQLTKKLESKSLISFVA